MDRNELIIAIAVLLFGAFVMGFIAHWAATRLSRVSKREVADMGFMAEALHKAEEARDAALAKTAADEARYRAKLSQVQSELRVAMEGLRDARRETASVKAQLGRTEKS